MFVKDKESLKKAHFEEPIHPIFDKDGNPIYRNDGKGIDWSKVVPIK